MFTRMSDPFYDQSKRASSRGYLPDKLDLFVDVELCVQLLQNVRIQLRKNAHASHGCMSRKAGLDV